jgi:hypothetical protein
VTAVPGLYVDTKEMSKNHPALTETVPQAAKRLLLAEPMRNGDDKRL